MRAILIDAKMRTITEVDLPSDYPALTDAMLGHVGAQLLTTAGRDRDTGDVMYVDDIGLYRKGDQPGFIFSSWHPEPMVGNGLILGCDGGGETRPARTKLARVVDELHFIIHKFEDHDNLTRKGEAQWQKQ